VLAIDSVGTELALSWYLNYFKVNLNLFKSKKTPQTGDGNWHG
jgi:hypothetical protein